MFLIAISWNKWNTKFKKGNFGKRCVGNIYIFTFFSKRTVRFYYYCIKVYKLVCSCRIYYKSVQKFLDFFII